MDVSVEKTVAGEALLTITLSVEEMRPFLERAAREISREVEVKGFRKGNVPYDVLKARVGEGTIQEQAAEHAIRSSFVDAVRKEELMTVGQPTIDVVKNAPENEFSYTASVALLPNVQLGEHKGLKAKRNPVEVTAKQTDALLEELRRSRAQQNKVDRPARKGDAVEVGFQSFLDKVPLEGGEVKKQVVEIGGGQLIPGFEDHLVGMKAGEQKNFTLRYPKESPHKHMAGKEVEFDVTLHTVLQRDIPTLDDAFARSLGDFATLAALKEQLTENMRLEKETEEERRFELALLEELAGKSTFGPFPNQLVAQELDKMVAELKHDLEHRGMEFAGYLASLGKTEDQLRTELTPQAEKRLRYALLTRELAARENITAAAEEVEQELSAQMSRAHDKNELERMQSPEYIDQIKNVVASRNVYRVLVKHSQQGEPKGRPETAGQKAHIVTPNDLSGDEKEPRIIKP